MVEARKTEAIIQVGQILQQQKPETFTTILFTGHRGCGKSTELHRLENYWKNQYLMIFLDVGLKAVAQIIEKRVNVSRIFASYDELLELVKASGGHIRQLMQLMQRACLTASGRGHSKIQAEDVDYAIKQLQFSFERSISKKYFAELAYLAVNKEFSDGDDDIRVQLLYSTAVLEYNGSDCWNYPNPLLMRSHAFTKAIANLKSA